MWFLSQIFYIRSVGPKKIMLQSVQSMSTPQTKFQWALLLVVLTESPFLPSKSCSVLIRSPIYNFDFPFSIIAVFLRGFSLRHIIMTSTDRFYDMKLLHEALEKHKCQCSARTTLLCPVKEKRVKMANLCAGRAASTHFFYKNTVYKNTEAPIC